LKYAISEGESDKRFIMKNIDFTARHFGATKLRRSLRRTYGAPMRADLERSAIMVNLSGRIRSKGRYGTGRKEKAT